MPGREVALIGAGASKFDSITSGVSYKELMYEAAVKAYSDAGIDARDDIGSFICCVEDFWDGNSITDEYMPDQIGAKLRPLVTVSGDGLLGIAHAYMHILAGVSDLVAVESHSKLSDVVSKDLIESLGFDPTFGRQSGVTPNFLAGIEMRRYLEESRNSLEECASVVVKNSSNALLNDRAVYGAKISQDQVMQSEDVATPLKELEISRPADGSVVLVLASAKKARKLCDHPIWLRGISWHSETSYLEDMNFGRADYAYLSSKKAYQMANISKPSQVDFVEIDDTFAYKELQHIEALGIAGRAGRFVSSGRADLDGTLPVNPSGGSLGIGRFNEATGLVKVYESVLQLRGQAGRIQLSNAKKCIVQSWRGIPTQSGVTAVLST